MTISSSLMSTANLFKRGGSADASVFTSGDPVSDPVALFLVQAALVIIISRTLGAALKRWKVPRVAAEVLTGILLGQTLLWLAPGVQTHLFPPESLALLHIAAEFGLILFFFLIGLELDPEQIFSRQSRSSVSVSIAGFAVPFLASLGVSKLVYGTYYDSLHFVPFGLFTALVLSITGFPVLTRILAEKRLLGSGVGMLALEVAKLDDIFTWALLAFVIPLVNNTSNFANAAYIFLIILAFAVTGWYVLKPIMVYVSNLGQNSESLSQLSVLTTFCLIFLCSWFTQAIGSNAIFGALLVGLRTPHNHGFAIKIAEKMEDMLMILFLPLYFANIGLNTYLRTLKTGLDWGLFFLMLTISSLGKILGTATASKVHGFSWRESTVLGILTNTKGYIGLIVLNMGYYADILDPRVYASLVLVMLVTTVMTIPVISVLYPSEMYLGPQEEAPPSKSLAMHQVITDAVTGIPDSTETLNETLEHSASIKDMSFLIYLPNAQIVPAIMSLMELFQRGSRKVSVTALRLVALTERESSMMMAQDPADLCKDDPLMSVVTTYGQLSRVRVKPMFAVAVPNDYARNITKSAVKSASNMIILPWQTQDSMSPSAQTSFEPLSDDLTDEVLSTASCSVALFMDRGFGLSPKKTTTTQKVVLLFFGQPDGTEALSFVSYFIGNEKCELVIVNAKIGHDKSTVDNFSDLRHLSGVCIEDIVCESLLDAATRFAQDLSKTDLVVLGHCHYKGSLKTWVDQNCKASVTLIQKYQKKITAGQATNQV